MIRWALIFDFNFENKKKSCKEWMEDKFEKNRRRILERFFREKFTNWKC